MERRCDLPEGFPRRVRVIFQIGEDLAQLAKLAGQGIGFFKHLAGFAIFHPLDEEIRQEAPDPQRGDQANRVEREEQQVDGCQHAQQHQPGAQAFQRMMCFQPVEQRAGIPAFVSLGVCQHAVQLQAGAESWARDERLRELLPPGNLRRVRDFIQQPAGQPLAAAQRDGRVEQLVQRTFPKNVQVLGKGMLRANGDWRGARDAGPFQPQARDMAFQQALEGFHPRHPVDDTLVLPRYDGKATQAEKNHAPGGQERQQLERQENDQQQNNQRSQADPWEAVLDLTQYRQARARALQAVL